MFSAWHATVLHALGPTWLDPQRLLGSYGLWGAAAVVFAECGLFFGFFLPGDSLLFTVGLFAGTALIGQPLWMACLVLTTAAFLGNVVGYELGRGVGGRLVARPDSRWLRRQHVEQARQFFDRHGARAVVLARFVPIVRTFITLVAGVSRMPRVRFVGYSGLGAVLWATGVTFVGYRLGSVTLVRDHLELMILGIVAVSLVPVGVEVARARKGPRESVDDE